MSNQTDMSNPSICIPRTFPNIGWQQVKAVFEELFGKGNIERVDVVKKTTRDGLPYNCMFVHFNQWSDDEQIQTIRQTILAGKTIKIVYDDPWYWKCSMSRVPRPEKRFTAKKPYIQADDEGVKPLEQPKLVRSIAMGASTE